MSGITPAAAVPAVDAELPRRAKAEGKSLNTVAIEALIRGAGLGEIPSAGAISATSQGRGRRIPSPRFVLLDRRTHNLREDVAVEEKGEEHLSAERQAVLL